MSDSHASKEYRDLNECRKPYTSRILAAPATFGHIRRKLEVIITFHKNARTEKYQKRVEPWFSRGSPQMLMFIQ